MEPRHYQTMLAEESPDLVVIEDSRLTSFVFTGSRQGPRQSLKIARNIGMVDGFCYLLDSLCAQLGIPIICVSPEGKGRKLKAKPFQLSTGYQGTSNQHERDAAMVARPYRHQKQRALPSR